MTRVFDLEKESVPSIIADLTYANYKHNRTISPNTTPQQWVKVYGPKALEMEKRFEQEMYDLFKDVP